MRSRYPRPWWLVLLIPTVGGLVSGLIVFTLAPEAEGHGTDALIRAFHRGGGLIRGRVPLIKGVASVITIGTGGSAGQEGPIAQIGAGFGSFLARLLRLTPERAPAADAGRGRGGHRRDLPGPARRRPVRRRGPLRDRRPSSRRRSCPAWPARSSPTRRSPCSSPPEPIFIVPDLTFHGLRELPVFAVLALACAAVGWLYVRVFYGLRDHVFKPAADPPARQAGLGGLLLGLLALAFPAVDDRRLRLGAVGGDRHASATWRCRASPPSSRRWGWGCC